MTARDRIRGCLLGGAVGDALGAPVEFLSRGEILARYGPNGIREMDVAYGVRGAITDDTQMTLFTAEGLILANLEEEGDPGPAGWRAQQRWLATQDESADPAWIESGLPGWLKDVPGLHARRAPGTTCLSALRTRRPVASAPIEAQNDSKGCGGVMRIAPVGLLSTSPHQVGCELAHQTHGHPLGWTSAGVFAHLIADVTHGASPWEAVARFVELRSRSGGPETPAHTEIRALLTRTLELADGDLPAHEAISELGEGWVAEEALAVAAFCALRFADDFEGGVVAAVNHTGDSDSTGAMAGQFLGVALGEAAIPARWLDTLELRGVVAQMADDLDTLGHQPTDDDRSEAPLEFRGRYGTP